MVNSVVFYILITLATITSLLFIIWRDEKRPVLCMLLKSIASAMFVIAGIVCALIGTNYTLPIILLVIGLVCGAYGDIALAFRDIPAFDKEKSTKVGMIAFGVAQIFNYLAISLLTGATYSWIGVVFGVVFAICIVFGERLLKMQYGNLKIFVALYSFILSAFFAQTIVYCVLAGASLASIILMLGATLFLASDLVLSFIYFKQTQKAWLVPVNLLLYYIAQILIVCGLFLL